MSLLAPAQDIAEYRVRFVAKADSKLMRAIAFFWPRFSSDFWTTLRLPFGRPTIYYPTRVEDPLLDRYEWILVHELIHVKQMSGAWGLLKCALLVSILPLPVLFSGRWWIERPAYLSDIRLGRRTPESAAEVLWRSYFYPWPRSWMVAWFKAQP